MELSNPRTVSDELHGAAKRRQSDVRDASPACAQAMEATMVEEMGALLERHPSVRQARHPGVARTYARIVVFFPSPLLHLYFVCHPSPWFTFLHFCLALLPSLFSSLFCLLLFFSLPPVPAMSFFLTSLPLFIVSSAITGFSPLCLSYTFAST
eukprot:975500-Pleurochrysis_carterae.AAC.2